MYGMLPHLELFIVLPKPTIYVITYHEFNHEGIRSKKPLDSRFLDTDKNYIFYLIDKKVPPILQNKQVILEHDLDPDLHKAGGRHLGEWSFLLAEAKHAFCQYPLFMISSRFYEKNEWLWQNLNKEWDRLFSFFDEYGYGYLPSYDRPIRWIDLSWKKRIEERAWEFRFFPFTEKTYELTKNLFGVDIPNDYRFTADLFCNYIGFKSRDELLAYVNYYRPMLDFFFNKDLSPKTDFSPYIRETGYFRNEKPFTFILELLCHLFFFQKRKRYFALHYDGYYDVDEARKKLRCIKRFSVPLKTTIMRYMQWFWVKMHSEGMLGRIKRNIRNHETIYRIAKKLLKK